MSDVRASKERAWREVAAIDDAYARGEIDDDAWHRSMAALVVPSYLAGDVRAGSGHAGSAADWDYSRGILADLVDRDRPIALLDIGCANGLLMESVRRWCPNVEPFGLDIAPALADLARQRLPHWADRIFEGNALHWTAPRRFDIARTGLEYVPAPRRRALLDHLLTLADRVIVGKFNEEIETRVTEQTLLGWGFIVERSVERPHRNDPRVVYRALRIAPPTE